jgi:protein-tyrosine phosphatase
VRPDESQPAAGAALLARHRGRKIDLEGSCNCRDLGGLRTVGGGRTRRGRVFRSDALATLTDADRARLAALGVRAVYDLRTEEERVRAPNRLAPDLPQHRLGFIPRGNREMFDAINAGRMSAVEARATMCEQYARLALDHTDSLGAFYRGLLARDGAPALVHCASGKDRTGVGVALLLLTVGVERDEVFEDYLLSHYQRRPIDLFVGEAALEVVDQIMAAREEYLAAGLAAIEREFGSFETFVARGLGLDAGARESLAALLVD